MAIGKAQNEFEAKKYAENDVAKMQKEEKKRIGRALMLPAIKRERERGTESGFQGKLHVTMKKHWPTGK